MCLSPYPGERRCGDAFLVKENGEAVLIAVVDALGHGDEAADIAEQAVASLGQTADPSAVGCLTACHTALLGSRGAAVTVGSIDLNRGELVWVGVGNVEAAALRGGANGRPVSRVRVPLRGGVVGYHLPPLRESTASLAAGSVLVLATDGVVLTSLEAVDLSLEPLALARHLHAAYARTDDDALVLVARWRSGRARRAVLIAPPIR